MYKSYLFVLFIAKDQKRNIIKIIIQKSVFQNRECFIKSCLVWRVN